MDRRKPDPSAGGGSRRKSQEAERRLSRSLQDSSDGRIREIVGLIKASNLNSGGGRRAIGGAWRAEEDAALKKIVYRDGEGAWRQKAEELNATMATLYQKLTSKAIAEGRTPVEYGRNASQCLHRWKKVLGPGLMKGHWSSAEDAALVEALDRAVEIAGSKANVNWSQVAESISGRSGKQCRERWYNHLNPDLTKAPWTGLEDGILFHAQRYFGPRWCEIERRVLPGRTANDVKNRFNSRATERWMSSCGPTAVEKTCKVFFERLQASFRKTAVTQPLEAKGAGADTKTPLEAKGNTADNKRARSGVSRASWRADTRKKEKKTKHMKPSKDTSSGGNSNGFGGTSGDVGNMFKSNCSTSTSTPDTVTETNIVENIGVKSDEVGGATVAQINLKHWKKNLLQIWSGTQGNASQAVH